MPDSMDRAQDLAAALTEDALAEHRARVIGPAHQWCIDCGSEIPVERREAVAGCTRCVDCQEIHERTI